MREREEAGRLSCLPNRVTICGWTRVPTDYVPKGYSVPRMGDL
jgi:hypothetical protein